MRRAPTWPSWSSTGLDGRVAQHEALQGEFSGAIESARVGADDLRKPMRHDALTMDNHWIAALVAEFSSTDGVDSGRVRSSRERARPDCREHSADEHHRRGKYVTLTLSGATAEDAERRENEVPVGAVGAHSDRQRDGRISDRRANALLTSAPQLVDVTSAKCSRTAFFHGERGDASALDGCWGTFGRGARGWSRRAPGDRARDQVAAGRVVVLCRPTRLDPAGSRRVRADSRRRVFTEPSREVRCRPALKEHSIRRGHVATRRSTDG